MVDVIRAAGIANALLSNAQLTGEKITADALFKAMSEDAATGNKAVVRQTAKDLKMMVTERLDPESPESQPLGDTVKNLRHRAQTDMKGELDFLHTLRSVCDTIAKNCPACFLQRVATAAVDLIDAVIENRVEESMRLLKTHDRLFVDEKPQDTIKMLDGKADALKVDLDRAFRSRSARRWRQVIEEAIFDDSVESDPAFNSSVANSAYGQHDVERVNDVQEMISLISTINIASDPHSIAAAISLAHHAIHQLSLVDWDTPELAAVRDAAYDSASELADLAERRVNEEKDSLLLAAPHDDRATVARLRPSPSSGTFDPYGRDYQASNRPDHRALSEADPDSKF